MDPNPARGMPLQLQRYWLAGKGAAKIRWNIPGDFKRCVRALTKHFPKNPEGLCNILHTKATGGPPGHGSAEHAMTAAAQALLAAQPVLGTNMWAGPLAPINRPTMEPRRRRIFEPGALNHRPLPLPLNHRRVTADGHQGSVTVGRILGITIGPDEKGRDNLYAWGDWLDESIVSEAREARYLVEQGVAGASLDPGGPVHVTVNPETGMEHNTLFTMGGATLVSIAAFDTTRIYNLSEDGDWPDDDADMAGELEPEGPVDCGCNDYATEFTVNSDGWRGVPLAPREAVFDNDDAVKRIAVWAGVGSQGADVRKLNQAFLWRDPRMPDTDPTSYRLPIGDIINGRLTMVFHAIYAAAALVSGAHGGLPNVSDVDKNQIRQVISAIYPEMAKTFNDSNIRAPWDRPANIAAREDAQTMTEFAAAEPYGDVTYADPGYRDGKKRYPLDTEEHCRAAWSYINQEKNAAEYNPKQLAAIKAKIVAALKKFKVDVSEDAPPAAKMKAEYAISVEGDEYVMGDNGFPVEPPGSWFENPQLTEKTPVTADSDGRVWGHLAAWNECHRDVTNRSCVLAPKSRKNYDPFHLGHVYTAEGERIKVGKIIGDTRHAAINLGYSAAAIHYDNTGDEMAVVRAGEDEFGIWVAGAMVPEADARKAAKLRRSPLSGDWRAVDGHLELTAALAVNVPAFPVYALDGEDQTALVAAGQVFPELDDEEELEDMAEPEFATETDETEEFDEAQDNRSWALRELDDDFTEWLAWKRAREFAAVTAEPGQAPVPVEGDDIWSPQAMAARQADAQFQIIEEPEGAAEGDKPEPQAPPVPAPTVPEPVPTP
jgi:hypothetical protein